MSTEELEPGFFDMYLPDVAVTDVLERVVTMASRRIPHCDTSSITLPARGRATTPVSVDERALRCDEAQYKADTGPCLEAMRGGDQVWIDDITMTRPEWAGVAQVAQQEGLYSILSLPLTPSGHDGGGEALGALNLYSEKAGSFDESARALAANFAHQAATVVSNTLAYWGARELAEQLEIAMESRATIEQAKGVIIAQSGITADAAFALLVRASQRENRKLRDIANDIVERAQKKR